MKKMVADKNIPYLTEYFADAYELVLRPGRAITAEDVKDADVLLVRSITSVNQALLKDSSVKFVGSMTAGADHLDTAWLDQANIKWCLAQGFNAPPVADYVVSCIAALNKQGLLLSKPKKAAVIGVGSVGRLVSAYLISLGFEVVHCDPIRAEQEADFQSVPLDELKEIDLITLHVPLTKTGNYPTYHFINKDFLQRQKLGCVLINASRGSVINSNDLQQYGSHLHWCFDVWEHEPHIDQAILEEAIIATPHIAGYSIQSKIRGVDMIYKMMRDQKLLPKDATTSPVLMPRQQLSFASEHPLWQDIVLGVFNPLVMSSMMKTILLTDNQDSHAFDNMRNQFTYRNEFAFTDVNYETLTADAKQTLEKLGLHLN